MKLRKIFVGSSALLYSLPLLASFTVLATVYVSLITGYPGLESVVSTSPQTDKDLAAERAYRQQIPARVGDSGKIIMVVFADGVKQPYTVYPWSANPVIPYSPAVSDFDPGQNPFDSWLGPGFSSVDFPMYTIELTGEVTAGSITTVETYGGGCGRPECGFPILQ